MPSRHGAAWGLGAAAVLLSFLVLGLISEAVAPAPRGPAGSSYATAADGAAAWTELLLRSGHPVAALRRPLDGRPLPPGVTLVVLDAQSLSPAAGANLRRFATAGGRLVIGGGNPGDTLPAVLPDPPHFSPAGPSAARAVARLPETDGVGAVLASGAGAWSSGAGIPALSGRGGTLLLVRRLGRGRLDLLADPTPVENRLLASADDAQLALNLAGPPGTPVLFAEALHGYGEATGLGAIPSNWWATFAGLCLAAGAWALSRGRRIGPPEPLPPASPPPRSAYVGALAARLVRARDADRLGIQPARRRR